MIPEVEMLLHPKLKINLMKLALFKEEKLYLKGNFGNY